MVLSLYDASVPSFLNGLSVLHCILEKAAAHGTSEAELIDARIHPDMKPLSFQIHWAIWTINTAIELMLGDKQDAMEDDEKTIAGLQARILKVVEMLKAVDRRAFDGKETKVITFHYDGHENHFTGTVLILYVALPNLFFHVTTAYDILRMKGVPLAKSDYLHAPQL